MKKMIGKGKKPKVSFTLALPPQNKIMRYKANKIGTRSIYMRNMTTLMKEI